MHSELPLANGRYIDQWETPINEWLVLAYGRDHLYLHFTTSLVTNLNMSRAAVIAHQTGPESQIGRNETAYIIMPGIEILLMSQRMEIRDGKEDWTGKSSIAEKRKLQNRLNQRAYRTCTYSPRMGTNKYQNEERSREENPPP